MSPECAPNRPRCDVPKSSVCVHVNSDSLKRQFTKLVIDYNYQNVIIEKKR